MAEQHILTPEQQVELVETAQERMDSCARGWLQNPKVKTALFRFDPQESNGEDKSRCAA